MYEDCIPNTYCSLAASVNKSPTHLFLLFFPSRVQETLSLPLILLLHIGGLPVGIFHRCSGGSCLHHFGGGITLWKRASTTHTQSAKPTLHRRRAAQHWALDQWRSCEPQPPRTPEHTYTHSSS